MSSFNSVLHPPYEAQIDQRQAWHGGLVDVWLYYRAGEHGTMVLEQLDVDGQWTNRLVPFGEDVGKPTFSLPSSAIAAIGAAAAEMHPPDRAQGAHLADAIKVRDELLEIVKRP